MVEDDDQFYEALAGDLEADGYRPLQARHGEEALVRVKERRPAVVTLDLELPGMDGWEVLKALKDDPATADIPVIIVSLSGNHELGFALGAEDYFMKPLERRQFLRRLQGILAGSASDPAAARRILIIDDDPEVHSVLGIELEESGYRVLSARDGRRGMELAVSERPAVIVLDLLMPEVNGFEVAAELRERPETAAIPIVILTAKELSTEDRRRLRGKSEGLFTKAPMDRRRLVRTIREIEARRGAREASDGD